jgi:superfamily II DNA helicase RecQ
MTTRQRGTQISKVMRHVFGVSELRPGQQAVIDAVLAKHHTLAIMPTGAGKSLCYQVPEMLMPDEERRQRDQRKLEQMVVYAQTALCRTHVLLEALGETVEWSQCGTCDNCSGVSIRSEAVAVGAA